MHAEIVMIGTELLLGEIVDTNATLLAQKLRDIGLDLYYKTTVGDNEARITEVLNRSLDRAEVIITSGGLGPTVDDVTRQAVANATGRKLVYSTELEQQIADRFRSFGRDMKANNKRQAYIPEGAMPLQNPVGTAPCFLSEDVAGRGFIISLPGVPRELEHMMDHVVVPLLIERAGGTQVLKTRILRTCGVGESNVDGVIADLMTERNPTVGLAAHVGQTDVRITAKAPTEAEAEALIEPMEAKIRARLGVAIYGVGKETVPEVVGRLLAERELSLAVLDTLTGGELAQQVAEAGFGHLLAADLHPADLDEAVTAIGLPEEEPGVQTHGSVRAAKMAQAIAPAEGVGLALVGPFADGKAYIAVHGPGERHLVRYAHNVKRETDYRRRWLIIQALDWVRRAVLGELTSPADWD